MSTSDGNSVPDAIVIGYGWAGSIIATELALQGFAVTVLERGPHRDVPSCGHLDHNPHGALPRFASADTSRSTVTLRHRPDEEAAPLRALGSFLIGEGSGGGGVLWGGMSPRFTAVTNWPITGDEIEPYYAVAETALGVASAPSAEFDADAVFVAAAAAGLRPNPLPTASRKSAYRNQYGVLREPCQAYGTTLATPQNTVIPPGAATGRITVVSDAHVTRILHSDGVATGALYTDPSGEHSLEASTVVLAAWTFASTRLLLLSGIGQPYDPATGEGAVGRGHTTHFSASAAAYFDDDSAGAPPWLSSAFDRGSAAAGGGRSVPFADPVADATLPGAQLAVTGASTLRYIGAEAVPAGTPRWGAGLRAALDRRDRRAVRIGILGESRPSAHRHLDLDPRYTDEYGDPLLRITFTWTDEDHRLVAAVGDALEPLLLEAGAASIDRPVLEADYNTVRYQNSHATGGTVAGNDPQTSVVDRELRSWDLPNLWVVGASTFPTGPAPNPTLTVAALAYRAAESIAAALREEATLTRAVHSVH